MGSGRAEATPTACGPSPGASLGPDAELSWAIEIGSRYSSLSKELIRAGVPTIMMDHFTSQKGLTGPAIRLDLRSSRGWVPAYELLASGGLAYIHFEPPRGTLAPHSRGTRAVAAKSKSRVRTPSRLDGVPSVKGDLAARLINANTVFSRFYEFARECHKKGVMITVSGPAQSLFWKTQKFGSWCLRVP